MPRVLWNFKQGKRVDCLDIAIGMDRAHRARHDTQMRFRIETRAVEPPFDYRKVNPKLRQNRPSEREG